MQKMDADRKLEIQQTVFALIKDGMSLKQASVFVGRHPTTVGMVMRDYRPYREYRAEQNARGERKNFYSTVGQTSLPPGYITVEQVAEFKRIAKVGDEIYYDTTDYGLPLTGTLVKKYPYMGLLKVSDGLTGIPWTWLTVMNRRRIEA